MYQTQQHMRRVSNQQSQQQDNSLTYMPQTNNDSPLKMTPSQQHLKAANINFGS